MPVIRKEMGEKSFVYIDASRNLANIYLLNGNYAASESSYLTAKTFYQSATLGTRSDRYRGVLADLGLLYTYSGQWAKAVSIYHDQVALNLDQVRNLFPLLSEKEKQISIHSRDHSSTRTMCLRCISSKRFLQAGEMYNLQLVSKSLLFRATDRVRTSVLNSKDEGLKELYNRWKTSRDQLSKFTSLAQIKRKPPELMRTTGEECKRPGAWAYC